MICACSIAFRTETIAAALPRLAQWGFAGVEAWGPHLDQLDDAGLDALRRQAADLGLAIPVVSPYLFLTRDDPELLARSLATAERSVHQARRLGALRIRTFVDAGPQGIGSAQADAGHWARAVANLRRITALAPELLFVIETHPNTLADTADTTLRLLREVGAANLRVLFQPTRVECLDDWQALRQHVHHVHLQQQHPTGHGHLDDGPDTLTPLLQRMATDGYAGTMSIEYCWPSVDPARLQGGLAWLRAKLGR
jgi:3-dehydroshikimate dehydratase